MLTLQQEYEDLLRDMTFSAFINLTWSISRKLKNISAEKAANLSCLMAPHFSIKTT